MDRVDQRVADDDGVLAGKSPKLRQLLASRKAWAGVFGLVTTLVLWALGEVDGARAIEAMTWVVSIFMGAVALEDGMTRLFSALAGTNGHAPEEGAGPE